MDYEKTNVYVKRVIVKQMGENCILSKEFSEIEWNLILHLCLIVSPILVSWYNCVIYITTYGQNIETHSQMV